jgi:DNA-binding MarR family transcriptional regulator
VSRLVDRLVSRGFLDKITDPSDGRGAIVTLTDAGYDAYRRVAVEHAESIRQRVGTRLDTAELTELARLCDKLRGAEG